MAFKLAATTFSTEPDEALAAVDAYDLQNSKPINAVPDILSAADLGSLVGLKGIASAPSLKMLSGAAQGLKVDKDALIKGVLGSNAGLLSALKGLPSTLQEGMTKAGGMSKILATVNGVTSIVSRANLSTLNGVGSLINGLATVKLPISFTDVSGLVNLSSNLIRQATSLNIPGVFKAVTDGIENKSIVNGIVRSSIGTVLGTGNVRLLGDMANSLSGKYIIKAMPRFAQDFTKKFVLPAGTRANSLFAISNSVTSSLSKIDKTWDNAQRLGQNTLNMVSLGSASADMRKLIDVQTSFRRQDTSAQSASTLNTSAIDNPLVRASAFRQFADQESTLSFFNQPLPGAPGLRRASQPAVFASVSDSLQASFPTVPNDASRRKDNTLSGQTTSRGAADQETISAKLVELNALLRAWEEQMDIAQGLASEIAPNERAGNFERARALRAQSDSVRVMAIRKYNQVFIRLTREISNAGYTGVLPVIPDRTSDI
jgi:hypothetical protein